MRTTRSIPIVLGLVALMAASVATVSAGGQPVVVEMTGAAERPGPGDPDGSGTAWFWFNRGQNEMCYAIQVEDILLPAIGAHIHKAPADSFAGVFIPLTAPDASGFSSGCLELADGVVKDLSKNGAEYYVNVHTTDFQPGAVRGQLG
jgi:hypothetical protein